MITALPTPDAATAPTTSAVENALPTADNKLRRFWANVVLDPERYQKGFSNIASEIVTNLAAQLRTELRITVDIEAINPKGFMTASSEQ